MSVSLYFLQELSSDQHFKKDPQLDAMIGSKFSHVLLNSVDIPTEDFLQSPRSSLAAVILFDQFPRNIFRNQPKSFEYDNKALLIADGAVSLGYHTQLPEKHRGFLLMPYMHSESLEMQNKGVELFAYDKDFQNYGILHRNIIERFQRFPHRNEILGRESTPEELEFLTQDGSSF